MTAIPNAVLVPRPDVAYRVVFDATRGGASSSDVSESLQKVARALNLFGSARVPRDKVDVAVVLHSDATASALSPAAYRAKFNENNPNERLLSLLAKQGVQLYVCGQALAERGFGPKDVSASVQTAQAALTAIAELQRRGYSLQAL